MNYSDSGDAVNQEQRSLFVKALSLSAVWEIEKAVAAPKYPRLFSLSLDENRAERLASRPTDRQIGRHLQYSSRANRLYNILSPRAAVLHQERIYICENVRVGVQVYIYIYAGVCRGQLAGLKALVTIIVFIISRLMTHLVA